MITTRLWLMITIKLLTKDTPYIARLWASSRKFSTIIFFYLGKDDCFMNNLNFIEYTRCKICHYKQWKNVWFWSPMRNIYSKHKSAALCWVSYGPGNGQELLNLRALKISMLYKNHIFQSMGKIFCVEFQRYPLKFHTKYLTHTLKDMIFMQFWNFKSS